jgi:hypothetical protein
MQCSRMLKYSIIKQTQTLFIYIYIYKVVFYAARVTDISTLITFEGDKQVANLK